MAGKEVRNRAVRGIGALAVGTVLVLLMTGCGPSENELADTLTEGQDEQGCERLLSGKAMKELTGDQDGFRTHTIGSLPACQALTRGENGVRVSVVRVAASTWGISQRSTFLDLLPVDPALPDADPRLVELMESVRDESLTDEESCELFTALAQETRGSEGPVVVASAPLGGLTQLSAQACSGGQFALVSMESASDLELTPEREGLLTAAVDSVHPDSLSP